MKVIAVLLKQVPDIRNAGQDIFNEDCSIKRENLPSICNPSDMKALEMALSVKDKFPGIRVIAVSMGPESAVNVLKEALFRGADDAVLLSDRAFAGADTLATSRTLSAALKVLSPDIVLCGSSTIDGGTSQVAPSVAALLEMADVFSVLDIINLDDNEITLKTEDNVLKISAPVLLSVSDSSKNCRYINIRKYIEYRDADIRHMNLEDLGLSGNLVGKKGSETVINNVSVCGTDRDKERVSLSSDKESINKLVETICRILH